jgi:large subunit ribosomal protein L6
MNAAPGRPNQALKRERKMSRVGNKPIPIPDKIEVMYKDRVLTVKGPKGSLSQGVHSAVEVKVSKEAITVAPLSGDKQGRALQGLTRSLLANMVTGVHQGFERALEINGIGYRAELKGRSLVFNLGYSQPVAFELPEGITATVEKNLVKVAGIDKARVGQTAASIRRLRPPEPYKGKGIKFVEEQIRRKAGKTGAK